MAPPDLPTRLRDTADNIHSRGPGIAAEHLREAAKVIDELSAKLGAARHSESCVEDRTVVEFRR